MTHGNTTRSAMSNGLVYRGPVPGNVQAVERAVAVLRTLAAAGRPLDLAEIAAALELPKTTAFGLVRTLRDVGMVEQHGSGGAYALGASLSRLEQTALDPHDLRSIATNWADALAARSRLEVLITMPEPEGARVVHHVFRPDDSAQELRTGDLLPLHATAAGKVLLAHAVRSPRPTDLERYSSRTITHRPRLDAVLRRVRESGWAAETGEFHPDEAGVGVALRGYGGLVVGAVSVRGPIERVMGRDGRPPSGLLDLVRSTAHSISRAVVT